MDAGPRSTNRKPRSAIQTSQFYSLQENTSLLCKVFPIATAMRPLSILSGLRSWISILSRPRATFRNLIQCFSVYNTTAWEESFELFDSGKKLLWEMIIPMILLQLLGSLKPISSVELQPSSVADSAATSYLVEESILRMLSPYSTPTLDLLSASSSPSMTIGKIPMLYTFDLSYVIRLMLLSLLSPVVMDAIFNHFAPLFIQVGTRLMFNVISRKDPDADARILLSQRVKAGRVIRRHGYDLYLPPLIPVLPPLPSHQQQQQTEQINSQSDRNVGPIGAKRMEAEQSSSIYDESKLLDNEGPDKRVQSLLFFPGFAIHHSAYADVAARMSDMGIPVAVVSLEPLRLAHKLLGGGVQDIKRLTKLAGKEVIHYYKRMQSKDTDDQTIIVDWALGGHSMGGYNILQLGEELMKLPEKPSFTFRDGSISRVSNQLIAWAAGPWVNSVPNLRGETQYPLNKLVDKHTFKSEPFRVLILLASKDNIAKFESDKNKLELLSKLPKRTTLLSTIYGGNHAGFASYDTAAKKSNTKMDGERDIPLEVQHVEACSQTVHFLLEH